MISSRTTLAFAAVALVLLGSQVGLYRASTEQAQASSWVAHTYEVIESMRSITDGVALAESSLRGFAVTGEPSVLPAFEDGISRAEQGLLATGQLTQDNPAQRERLRILAPQLRERISQLQQSLVLAHDKVPVTEVVTPERVRGTSKLRAQVEVMVHAERQLLAERLTRTAEQTVLAQRIALFGMLLSIVLCGVGAWIMTHQNRTLRDAEEELRLTVDQAPIGVGLVSTTGSRWLRVNDALCRILGRSREELLRQSYEQMFHADDRAAAVAQVKALLDAGGSAEHLELRSLRGDGSVCWIDITSSLVRSSSGAPRFVVLEIQDISARRRAESEARTFFEQSVDLLAIADAPTKLQKVNAAWQRTLGWTAEQLTAGSYLDFLHPEDRERIRVAAGQVRGGPTDSISLRNRFRNVHGEYRWLDWRVHPTYDGRYFCVARDVTGQVEREQSLHVFQQAITAAPSGVLMTDPAQPDNPITYVNPAFERMTGYSAEELLGKSCRLLQGADRDQPAVEQLRQAIREQRECRVVLRNYRKSGELFLNALTISPVRDNAGGIARYVGIAEDVTDRQRNEEQLRMLASITRRSTEQQPLDTALNQILREVCETQGWDYGELWRRNDEGTDIDCHDVWYSRQNADLSGVRAECGRCNERGGASMVHRTWSSGRAEWCEDLRAVNESFSCRARVMLQAGLRGAVTVPIYGPGGSEGVLLMMRSAPLPRDAQVLELLSTVGGQIGLFIQRQRAEHALRMSEERLNYATRATSDVVFDYSIEHNRLWLSEALERNFGYRVSEVPLEWWSERLHPDDAQAVLPSARAAIASEQARWSAEYRFACSDGHYAHVFHRAFILRDAEGQASRVIGSLMDVSERVRNEEAMREAKSSAEAAARIKTAFLANMSHEIRTPLTALLGFADLLLDPGLEDAERLSYAAIIRSNGEHLLAILNDVLDVAKLESGKLTIEQIEFSPSKVLAEIASLMRVKALEKGLTFSVSADPPLPAVVRGDPTRLRQILLNLVSNAVKFTEAGSVRVVAHCQAAADGGGSWLEVRVSDTGIGMEPAQVQRLFQPFSQADSSTTRRFGGTGLGLAICGPLVRAMGGVIEVKTEPQRGSEFNLRLPVEIAQESAALGGEAATTHPPSQREEEQHGSILLAEDGPDNQRLISTLLRKQGFDVEIVDNGLHAVERALAAASSGAAYDVILMDMQMPRLDGYQATARLRASGYRRPILALTAHAMEGERSRCIEAGCDDHLAKPIQRKVLLHAVSDYVERAQHIAGPAPTPRSSVAPRSQQTTGPANDIAPAQPSATVPQSRSSERAPSLQSTLADDAGMGELIASFVAGMPAQLATLRIAVERGDREQLLRLVHQLKGAAGGYGFPAITAAARALEQALRADLQAPLPEAWQELQRLCEATQPRAPSVRPKPSQPPQPKLLVIDDAIAIRDLISVHLGGEGMQLSFAQSAHEGLASAFENTPDVILLDLDLPDGSGLDVCRELKQDVRTANVPVLFLTGTEDSVVKATAFDLGAIDYVTKPFDKVELRARVRSALRVKRYQDLLTTRAQLDGLTGLWNRAYFDARLREELLATQRHRRPLSIAMLDLDHFKKINDSYGHPFGDYVLQTVASALVRTLRTGDVACRYGGEELVVILRDTPSSEAAVAAERIRKVISELELINRGQRLRVTVSIGVTSVSAAALASATPELLIEAADSALYQAKHEGRARVVLNPFG